MTEPTIPIAQIDAFTDRPFAGNPAAVCLLPPDAPRARDARWMQAVAAEMNLSETAFVVTRGGRTPGGFRLRWFTPETEVELCGHATLASAHLLWESGRVPPDDPIRFDTASGPLTCERTHEPGDGAAPGGSIVWMDFPAQPADELEGEGAEALRDELAGALGSEPVRLGRTRFDLLVELASEEAVRGLRPDLARLATVETQGIIVTAAAGPDRPDRPGSGRPEAADPQGAPAPDFVSRYFGPRVGVPEDPVTGSAHCSLAPWWGARLGRERMVGYQASRRGGTVRTVLAGDRVLLGGRAVTVFTGELHAGGAREE
jgi:PhzF family phenazine biosynthesis protein